MFDIRQNSINEAETYDFLIVGAGPSGAFAAEKLALQGARVALFDGRFNLEQKPCGGGVTSKALAKYGFLKQAAAREISEIEFFSASGKRIYLKLAEPFAIFSREVLDEFLIERAEKAGAHIFRRKVSAVFENDLPNGDLWTLREYGADAKNIWRGKFLIAADGANSAIAKKLAGNVAADEMEVGFGYRVRVPNIEKCLTSVIFLPERNGYAWAFPRLDHVSFGIATSQKDFDRQTMDELLRSYINGYLQRQNSAKTRIWQNPHGAETAHLLEKAEKYAARIPSLTAENLRKRAVAGKNWALIGDAAGFADAVTGEGIFYALRSAELFAEAFAENNLPGYAAKYRTDFGAELIRAAELKNRFYGDFYGAALTERMIQAAQIHPRIRALLGELIAGNQSYMNLKKTLVRRFLYLS